MRINWKLAKKMGKKKFSQRLKKAYPDLDSSALWEEKFPKPKKEGE